MVDALPNDYGQARGSLDGVGPIDCRPNWYRHVLYVSPAHPHANRYVRHLARLGEGLCNAFALVDVDAVLEFRPLLGTDTHAERGLSADLLPDCLYHAHEESAAILIRAAVVISPLIRVN